MMKRIGETAVATGLAFSLALGATACGSNQSEHAEIKCTGVDFASPKGGPGNIVVNVFPVFNRNLGDAAPMVVSGEVEAGNSAGTKLTPTPEIQAGWFNFVWKTADTSEQNSVVAAKVDYEGATYTCTPTTLRFNPQSYKVTPHLADSPY